MFSQMRSFLLILAILSISTTLSYSFKSSMGGRWVRLATSTTQLSAKIKHKLTIQHEGKETTIECAENVSVLTAAKDAGIELPHDCELGVCLTCPAKVISGKVDHSGSTLEDSVAEQGYALTCCTFPRSDVTIRSIDEDELVSAQFGREIEKKLQ